MALTKPASRTLQRQIDLTTAVCQERLLTTHLRHLLAFVELVEPSVPFDAALDIYVRILRLSPEQARNVGSRALAEIGRRSGVPSELGAQLSAMLDEGPDDEPESASVEEERERSNAMFARLRRRIRGRVQDELRFRIDLAAARAEDALLETHVENALIFVRALRDELQPTEAVELYLETMLLPEGLADVIYNRTLRLLADEALPPLDARDARERREPVVLSPASPAAPAAAG